MKRNENKGGYVGIKQHKIAYLFCLLPIVLTGLYLLSLSIDGTYSIGDFMIFSPLSMFSLFSLFVLLAMVFLWGCVGYLCAKARLTLIKSLIVCHIFPLMLIVAYFILNLVQIETGNESLKEVTYIIGGIACNFISIVGTFIYYILPINIVEPVVNLFVMVGAFIVGYVISTSRKKKTTN